MSMTAAANLADLRKFHSRLESAEDVFQDVMSDLGFDDIKDKIAKENEKFQEAQEKNNDLKEFIGEKKDKCEDKINKTEKAIDDLKKKIEDTKNKSEQLSGNPATAALAAAEAAKLAALVAKLAAEEANLVRLREALKQLEQHERDVDERDKNIVKQIEKLQETSNKIDEIEQKMMEKLSDTQGKVESGAPIIEKAISALEEYLGTSITEYADAGGKYVFENKFIRDDELKKTGITAKEQESLHVETTYSDTILSYVRTEKEAKLYLEYGLVEGIVGGRPCLMQPYIEWERPIPYVWRGEIKYAVNIERMQKGNAPVLANGGMVELHHIGQNPDSPFAELSASQHRGQKTNKILHTSIYERSRIERNKFAMQEKKPYWRARAAEYTRSQQS